MSIIEINGVALHYREFGQANSQNPRTLVFAHSLLWDGEMFDAVVAILAKDFHIINIDQHGHGQSGFRTPLTLDEMAADYAVLIDTLNLKQVDWVGLSMGGMVGMRLALAYPDKIRSLTLMDTSARPEPPEQRESSEQLAELLRAGKAAEIADVVLQIFFAPATFKHQPELIEHYRNKLIAYREIAGIHQATLAVFGRSDISNEIAKITAPTLVIVGKDDVATLPAEAELMASRIPGAHLVVVEHAAHMAPTEQPEIVANAMRSFLAEC